MMVDHTIIAPPSSALSTHDITPAVAISVRGIGKMYRIYNHPQDRLKQMLLRGRRTYGREFWALRDISFDIAQGETVGVVGRNGSGKSTLLQIIAGTLAPTTGSIGVSGRVAALLELGSGFNPEFSGRENVFLNGAILGISRQEMELHLADIIAFADIGEFIDQPVKLYSSGMAVRLAFAVQLFVPKDVLLVDEALAVGDEAFQRKCMAAIKVFQQHGGTVLLVTHDTQMVVRHCTRCILLAHGQLIVAGESKPVCDLYQKIMYSDAQAAEQLLALAQQQGLYGALRSHSATTLAVAVDNAPAPTTAQAMALADWFDPDMPTTSEVVYGNGDAQIAEFGVYDQHGKCVNVLTVGRRYAFTYIVHFAREARDVHFGMMLKTIDGLDVAGISSNLERLDFDYISASSTVKMVFSIRLNVSPGTYFVNAGVGAHIDGTYTYLQRRVDMCMLRVLPPDSRSVYGVAYLEPRLSAEFLTERRHRV